MSAVAAVRAPARRGLAPAAVLFPLLMIAAFVFAASPPAGDATAAEVVAFYEDNETATIVASILGTLAAGAFVWFTVVLARHLARPDTGFAAVAAGVLVAVGLTVFAGIEMTAASAVEDLSPESVQVLNALDNGMYFTVALGILVFYATLAVASLRHGALPRPLGYAAAALAVVALTPAFFVGIVASFVIIPILGRVIAGQGS